MGQLLHRHRTTLTIAFGALLMGAAVLASTAFGDDEKDRNGDGRGDRRADIATNMGVATAGANLDRMLDLRDRFVEDVAAQLDQHPARVQGAVRTVIERWLDRYERDGLVTRSQADALLDCWDGERCEPLSLMGRP